MEFFLEIFLTVVLSVAMAFLFAKLVSKASSIDDEVEQQQQESTSSTLLTSSEVEKDHSSGFDGGHVVVEEKSVGGDHLKNRGLEIETKVVGEEEEEDYVVDKFENYPGQEEEEEILRVGCELVEVEKVEEGKKEEELVETVKEEELSEEEEEEKLAEECPCPCKEEEEEVNDGLPPVDFEPEGSFVQESSEKDGVPEMGADLGKHEEVVIAEEEEEGGVGVVESEGNQEIEIGTDCQTTQKKECLFSDDDDDDWEGIERSEMEKLFGAASTFVTSGKNNESLSKLGSDVQMQLLGLHKVATEGPCREPQPLALMVSSRAKWHAWQRLGNMSPEVAMEEYIALLSHNVPGWMVKNHEGGNEQDKHNDIPAANLAENKDLNSSSSLHHQLDFENERKPGSSSCGEGGGAICGP